MLKQNLLNLTGEEQEFISKIMAEYLADFSNLDVS